MVLCQLELPISTVDHTLALCAEPASPSCSIPRQLLRSATRYGTRSHGSLPTKPKPPSTSTTPQPRNIAQHLLDRGLRGVVLKRGAEGAYVAIAGGKAGWVKPFTVNAIDTVAAGDCFNGAFAVGLLEGLDPGKPRDSPALPPPSPSPAAARKPPCPRAPTSMPSSPNAIKIPSPGRGQPPRESTKGTASIMRRFHPDTEVSS